MKTALFILVISILTGASIFFIHENNGLRDKLDMCHRQVCGYEKENEQLSNLLVKARMGGEYPHMKKE